MIPTISIVLFISKSFVHTIVHFLFLITQGEFCDHPPLPRKILAPCHILNYCLESTCTSLFTELTKCDLKLQAMVN